MKISKLTSLITLLLVGSFMTISCSSRLKRTETVSTPREVKTERTETVATTEPSHTTETTPADLGATSAGRSR